MKIVKFGIIAILLIVFLGMYSYSAPKTRTQIIQAVYDRGLDIDSFRCADTVFHRWIDEESKDIAVMGNGLEKDTMIELQLNSVAYALPSDFYLFHVAILNSNPADPTGAGNPRKRLKYRPMREYGDNVGLPTGRPRECYISTDSLYIETFPTAEYDTIYLTYFAYPSAITRDTSIFRLPEKYEKLLIDRLTLKYYNRIKLQSVETKRDLKADIMFLEQKLLGRPSDED